MSKLQPVLLSGGSGTRLWPLSREAYPKQFLPLGGEDTMVQATWRRVEPLTSLPPLVVANEDHRFLVAEQLREIKAPQAQILLEPVARNTAPAIAAAALCALEGGDDPLLLVLPSDHVITNPEGFRAAVEAASPAAEAGALVTFGVVPSSPETGFGYIQADKGQGVQPVLRFVEKPDAETAAKYLAEGTYFWNSGMFLFKASRYIEELQKFQPEMVAAVRASLEGAKRDGDFIRLNKAAFEACPSDSIDYAVMEKTADAKVLPLDVGWNDVGSWSALWDVTEKDANGNACSGDVITVDTHNSYVYAESLVALVGLDDVVVVETDDSILVAKKDRVQEVKKVVAQLKHDERSQAVLHRKVYRPWGAYDSIDMGARFQVKRITVNPGATLSLQMHHHRAEHWIVVSGTAEVTRGDEVILLTENQSTYIPLGVTHRLKNPGRLPLELIEVQSGSYLGEDDIVRFEDQYGRS
ncbi:mannose-1-phosphate guanylyltransferase / mannose-6-phosphate isomerase [Pseudoxanthomonas sp. GM95]|uniref:mannose-1-phosphate guanylyltransferase/mannose-6-phosphate isomerase n=1 Tax=Pseudoxanthomonas sp. GM95 TaxID=1881043 RepID=UPI0008D0551E|nr:mannose-1-phosphate guanylyltransferase/mannose-6-phosphate isomerase [Pseudoxanthomonas sp. GM95]SEL76561.1 mannose-1-phosphate guanylyltransferase / mannose-6-phosphate isomerase [Pseudoxanthomonas sp. GM95]